MNTDELMDVTPTNMGGGGESSIAVFEARPDASSTPAIMSPGESTKLDSQTTTADNGSGSGSTAPGNAGPGAWNTKKFRDEYEMAKARLVDRDFSSGKWQQLRFVFVCAWLPTWRLCLPPSP